MYAGAKSASLYCIYDVTNVSLNSQLDYCFIILHDFINNVINDLNEKQKWCNIFVFTK